MKGAVLFVVGLAVGAAAWHYLSPRTSLQEHERMARALRLAEERADKCEAGR